MTLNLFARLGLALLMALPVVAHAETDELPPLPDRNPGRLAAPARNPARVQAPVVETPVLPGDAATVPWTDAEIAAAKADCTKRLAGLALDYEVLPPIKEGMCGAPAPILLKAVGSDPKVEIDPPATVTCAVAASLSAWLGKTVQPEARALIGAPVVKLSNASSYVCRNRYNGTDTPLSEHALANALDVSEFVTKGLRMYGIHGRLMYKTWMQMGGLLNSGNVNLKPILTHRFPLDDYNEAMEVMRSGNCGKVAFPMED